jgi:GNAT superfamily N-acetyltransferase
VYPAGYRAPVPTIRPLDHDRDAEGCDAIVASLPAWFGVDEGIRECARDVRAQTGLVSEVDGRITGFLTYVRHSPATAEITWMGVHASERGRGTGTALMERLVTGLSASGARLLLVKTLSDRVDPGPEYAATRAFYTARGFRPAAELDLYGPENPIQLMSLAV